MCDKAILEKDGTLEPAPDCCKNRQTCDKSVDNYPQALKFFPYCYMCDKALNTYDSTI